MRLKIGVIIIGSLWLAGCGNFSSDDAILKQKTTESEKNQNSGYISNLLETKEQAKQNIQNSMNKENARLNKTLEEVQNDYVKKYSAALMETNWGKIKVKLYNADAPQTVNNFLQLADKKFYDGTKFHRVIKGFMIQGGDPNSKDDDWSNDGQGGPGYTIPAEIKLKNTRGTLATARLGDQVNPEKNSSGSQFYINTVNNTSLDGGYTVFGEVMEGMDIVDKIENVKINANKHPMEDVVIENITLLEK